MDIIEAVPHRADADSFQFRVSLGHLKQAVVARRWVVLGTTVMTTVLVSLYLWIWPATFQAEVLIAADSDKDMQRTSFYNGWNVFRREGLVDEATLLTAGPVLKETIQRLDLKYTDMYHPFLSYATYLWTESWVGKHYRMVKNWLFPKKPSRYEPTPEEIESYKVLADFREGVKVEQVKDASIGTLIVKGSNQRVAEIANTMADIYLRQRRDRQLAEAEQAQLSLADEVAGTKRDLEVLDSKIEQYRRQNGLLLYFEKDKAEIGQYQAQQIAVAELQAQIAEKQASLSTINSNLASEGKVIDSDRVFKNMATQDRLAKLQAQLAQTRQLFQADAPEVQELEDQIRIGMAEIGGEKESVVVRNPLRVGESYELLHSRKVALESQLDGDKAALGAKERELERQRLILGQIPDKMKVSHEYEREQVALESKLQVLTEKLNTATVSLATTRSAPPAMRIVEYAVASEQPVWPKTKLFLLVAVLTGLLLGAISALILELAFVRVSRYRLWEQDSTYRVFAVVDQDVQFLNSLYLRAPPRRLTAIPGH